MYILIEFLGLPFGVTLQQLNKMFYNRLPKYIYECALFVYKQLVQAKDWEKGVNEKKFLANQPSPYNPVVAFEHNGKTQTGDGYPMFNMILRDGTRSDNPMTVNG